MTTNPLPWSLLIGCDTCYPELPYGTLKDRSGKSIAHFRDARDAEFVLDLFEQIARKDSRIFDLEDKLENAVIGD